MSVKLLTEHHLKFLSLKEAAQACLSLHLSKCHIVGNHMSRLICSYPVHYSGTWSEVLKGSTCLKYETIKLNVH